MEINLSIISKSGLVYSGKCSSISLPLEDGLYGILPNHSPAVIALSKGNLFFETEGNKSGFCISDGIMVFENNNARVLVGTCTKT